MTLIMPTTFTPRRYFIVADSQHKFLESNCKFNVTVFIAPAEL